MNDTPSNAPAAPPLTEMYHRLARPGRFADDEPLEIAVEVIETEREYRIRAAVGLATREELHVSVDGRFVAIVAEVGRQSAARGLRLAHDVDARAAVARWSQGRLDLQLPKLKGGRRHPIVVR